jgi:hypothetical protein
MGMTSDDLHAVFPVCRLRYFCINSGPSSLPCAFRLFNSVFCNFVHEVTYQRKALELTANNLPQMAGEGPLSIPFTRPFML